jgi:hypothetical protein
MQPKNRRKDMGNYKNIEIDFVQRTLNLIAQYESILHNYEYEKQYNYTLLINCLLGLIILPKEKSLSYLPGDLLDEKMKTDMGIRNSIINSEFNTLRKLIIALRHSISHFNINVISDLDNEFAIDQIIFEIDDNNLKVQVANFRADELLPFVRYYATWLLSNIKKYKNNDSKN